MIACALLLLSGAAIAGSSTDAGDSQRPGPAPFVIVLGLTQDGGLPHAGCQKPCCQAARTDANWRLPVVCLGLVDPPSNARWLIEATPDLPTQLRALQRLPAAIPTAASRPAGALPLDGILVTHAHVGHYTGLMHLGREVMGARGVPVYAMPRMRAFLARNGPWDQLVALGNIELRALDESVAVALNDRLTVTPIRVPHRDEYSETVGFQIIGPHRRLLFIPDVDKWERWDRRLEDALRDVDVAYLDGTFYAEGELGGRSMAEVPHPLIVETIQRLAPLPAEQRGKVRFIHLNHTNPALQPESDERKEIERRGFRVAELGERVEL